MITVGLVNVNSQFEGHQSYLPYTVGCLQAYAMKHLSHPENYRWLLPVYNRMPLDEAVEQLASANIVGFANYVWNERYSLELARRLRERGDMLIVFGGPQVPDHPERWLRDHPWVNAVIHGEGEKAFCAMLNEDSIVPSMSMWVEGKGLIQTPKASRITDLSEVPSPYQAGIFDQLMLLHPEEDWIAIWETDRGCPWSCSWCDWGSLTASKMSRVPMERVHSDVAWFAANHIEFTYLANSNYGMFSRDIEISTILAKSKQETGYPKFCSTQSAKNVTDRVYRAQKILNDAGMNKGVTLGIQSLNPDTLKAVDRENISLETYHELQRRYAQDGVPTYTDLILGQPGETYDSWVNGICELISRGQHGRIQMNRLSVLPNAPLADLNYIRKHGLKIIDADIINIHGVVGSDDVIERQKLVIGTNTMTREDWIRAMRFSWWVALLHFDKLLQIPIILLQKEAGLTYREIFEEFTEIYPTRSPQSIIGGIDLFFQQEAERIASGGAEYAQGPLNIYWPQDELVFIRLAQDDLVSRFYADAQKCLMRLLERQQGGKSNEGWRNHSLMLDDAVFLNQCLLKVPINNPPRRVRLGYNIWEVYQGVLTGHDISLELSGQEYVIRPDWDTPPDFETWCRQVIWFQNKRAGYLHTNVSPGVVNI